MDAERDKIIARIAARRTLLFMLAEIMDHGRPWTARGINDAMALLAERVGNEIANDLSQELPPACCPQCGVTFWEDDGCGCWDDDKLVVLCGERCKRDWWLAGQEQRDRDEADDRDVSSQIQAVRDRGL